MDNQKKTRKPHVKRVPIRTASPILKAIFEEMLTRQIPLAAMAEKLDTHPNRVSEYRRGMTTPSVMVVEEMAGAMDCQIVLQRNHDYANSPERKLELLLDKAVALFREYAAAKHAGRCVRKELPHAQIGVLSDMEAEHFRHALREVLISSSVSSDEPGTENDASPENH